MSRVQLVARSPMVVREERVPSESLVPFVRYAMMDGGSYVTDAEAFPAARANARDLVVQYEAGRGDPYWVARGPHVHALFAAASVQRPLFELAGDAPVLAMPTTSLLLVGRTDTDPRYVLDAATVAYDAADDEARLSCTLYGLDRCVLRPLHLPAAHPSADVVMRAHRRLAIEVYNEQKDHYEGCFDELDPVEESFWASALDVSGEDTAKNWTASVWSEGLPTLLPETELVIFKPVTGRPLILRWEDMLAVLGDTAPPVFDAVEPVRYRANRWPTPAELAALEARSISL